MGTAKPIVPTSGRRKFLAQLLGLTGHVAISPPIASRWSRWVKDEKSGPPPLIQMDDSVHTFPSQFNAHILYIYEKLKKLGVKI